MTKISLIRLGHLKRPLDFRRLVNWRSEVLTLSDGGTCSSLGDGTRDWQEVSDSDFSFVKPSANADVTIAITEYALEDNFFLRRLKNTVVILSLSEVADVLETKRIPVENFILRCAYEISVLHHLYQALPATTDAIPEIFHDETRSCIFDLCGIKNDVAFSCARPILCDQCRAIMTRRTLPSPVINKLPNELKRIRIPLYYRLEHFIKCHPILSIAITAFAGIFLNMVASLLYDVLKSRV